MKLKEMLIQRKRVSQNSRVGSSIDAPREGQYYSLSSITDIGAQIMMIYGERSNGKSYAVTSELIKDFFQNGRQFAYIRRWADDIKGPLAMAYMGDMLKDNKIYEYSKGEYDDIIYRNRAFYPAKYDEDLDKLVASSVPMGFAFGLSTAEKLKSTQYPYLYNMNFEEFMTRDAYLPDEFTRLMNLVSTLKRGKEGFRIFMIANTVNKYCPLFTEMGLFNAGKMKQGTIDVYEYGDSGLKVAVEYCSAGEKGSKKTDDFFAFDNPKLKMITGGDWELDLYPHKPVDFVDNDIVFTYFIDFQDHTCQCEVVQAGGMLFTYIHRKTTPIRNPETDLVFTDGVSPQYNIRTNILKPFDKVGKSILSQFHCDKVFYQDNEVGELINNYMNYCKTR